MSTFSLEEIKNWEKRFAKERGFHPQNAEEAEAQLTRNILHLQEELGEGSRAFRGRDFKNLMEEMCDILLFIAKTANILEEFYDVMPLEVALERKLRFNEARFPKISGGRERYVHNKS